ncbi:MAG: aconitate hydratase [Chrysiogenetes bacterium]|nr:aconitate hydratase [Chrysiogenetes bacterium]
MPKIETTPELVKNAYESMRAKLATVRERLGRPLSLAEKVLLGHLDDPKSAELEPGKSYLLLRPDRVAMQDATAQMAILQFMLSGKTETAVPSTVHCDHLIRAHSGAGDDMNVAMDENKEVYDFLSSAAKKYGMGFWKPGAGIIHQVVLENYAFPGGMMIGTDSHTPNAGGLGMVACGVGGADAVDVMAGFPWEVLYPKRIGVKLTGKMGGWTSPKDVIVRLCGILTVKGGTNAIVEYFGEGARNISCTGKATITNMGAELGATCSIFPFDDAMDRYLRATDRAGVADLAKEYKDLLEADAEVEADPEKYFDQVVEIDLSTLEPQITGPHSPDRTRGISELAAEAKKEGFAENVTAALIGSCTNSSYEDISRVVDLAQQALGAGLKAEIPFLITPGSDNIFETIKRDGQMEVLEKVGATVLANACGPCIGQWQRDDVAKGTKNSIVSSFNRNFPARNDGNPATESFITSPEIVFALAMGRKLSFNPLTDEIPVGGKSFKFKAPAAAPDLPANGFVAPKDGYQAPASDASNVEVKVSPESDRLQILTQFPAWDGKDYEKLPVLLKAQGKCTTDHISPAGTWLKYRGHLDNISNNMFLGAKNAFSEKLGFGINVETGEEAEINKVARDYRDRGMRWVAVGDENYGEGSSREHAAMEPRHLGGAAVIVRSFARIHQSNLKKQGILPLTFADPVDYDKIDARDRISIVGLAGLAPGKQVDAIIHKEGGEQIKIKLNHTLNDEQIAWFKAGSALNQLRNEAGL